MERQRQRLGGEVKEGRKRYRVFGSGEVAPWRHCTVQYKQFIRTREKYKRQPERLLFPVVSNLYSQDFLKLLSLTGFYLHFLFYYPLSNGLSQVFLFFYFLFLSPHSRSFYLWLAGSPLLSLSLSLFSRSLKGGHRGDNANTGPLNGE